MKTQTTAAALGIARATLGPAISVSEDGGHVLITAADRPTLVAAYTVVRKAIESTGRATRAIKCDGKLAWTPPRSEMIRGGMRFDLTAEEHAAHLRGF